ncbi:MAG: PadR family transcriptional regulator [Clostridia bacterium]|nr:PadR family transcriptional regulator [Clostridia bacterium]
MDVQLKRGILDVCVLTVLRRGESYGYRLVRDVGEIIDVSESTLYPILKRLEANGQVTVHSAEHNGRLRKYYRITESGEERIRAFLDEWRVLLRALSRIEAEVGTNE